jgi:hypothetical protein
MFPLHQPELADLIDGAIGEGSPFHDTFGYYAQGVGPETALLPEGWRDRLIAVQNQNTDLKIGFCLEPHDLSLSKLAAGREKDWPFVKTMLNNGIVDKRALIERLESFVVDRGLKTRLAEWIGTQ